MLCSYVALPIPMILYLKYCLDCFADGYNFNGGDLPDKTTSARDANNCQRDCLKTALCNYWTFDTHKTEKNCYLKRDIDKVSAYGKYQSGPRNCLTIEHADKEQKKVNLILRHTHTFLIFHLYILGGHSGRETLHS